MAGGRPDGGGGLFGSLCFWRLLAVSAVLYIVAEKTSLAGLTSQEEKGGSLGSSTFRDLTAQPQDGALGGRALAEETPGDGDDQSAEESEHHENDHAHAYEAIFFLVAAIMIGTALLHLTFLKVFKGLQQTVVLFLLGCASSWLLEGTGFRSKLGAVGRSYGLWLAIDPHLLLFTLLPPLLAGDAMSIDTHLARRVAKQCLYLAGPGVAINAAVTAVFLWLYLPYEWPFLLCLTTGAILCATDPVAVVALLKELGASPTLTVQIQGESLLNDGTAIVLYMVTYNMLMGEEYSAGDLVVFLVKTALYAWLLGTLIGFGFFAWIRAAKNKLDHNSSLIQVALTIACAYLSFAAAEGLFHISGVLSTVAASLVLAHRMWPEVVCHETMKTVWHMLEYLGNTLIFFLAGALTGNIMVRIPFTDYLHLISIYVALLLVRAGLVLLSRPILRLLHPERQPVSLPDAMVISWGGLRGAVGLALAIQVSITRAGGSISQMDADRVLFYVGGVALLTLAVNATTCPALVRVLGVAQTPEVKVKLMHMLHARLFKELSEKDCTQEVRRAVETMLEDLQHHIGGEYGIGHEPSDGPGVERAPTMQQRTTLLMQRVGLLACSKDEVLSKGELTCKLTRAADRYELVPAEPRELLQRHLPTSPLSDKSNEMLQQVIQAPPADPQLLRAVNEAFLSLVRAQYWKQIEEGALRPEDARPLIMSVTNALSGPCHQLSDLDWICPSIKWPDDDEAEVGRTASGPKVRWQLSEAAAQIREDKEEGSCLRGIVESSTFNAVIVSAIVVNALIIFSGHGDSVFLEVASAAFFAAELLLRLAALGCCGFGFLGRGGNVLDSVLVIFALGGLVLRLAGASVAELSTLYPREEVQVARSLVVLYKLPAVDFGRICRAARAGWAELCGTSYRVECAMHITKLEILFHFIRAHTAAQQKLVRFLGLRSKGTGAVEVRQCILMSQISVYHAKTVCAYEEEQMHSWMLDEKQVCQESVKVTTELEHFVESARGGGVLSSSEAELLIHTMGDYVRNFEKRISKMRHGRMTLGPQYASSSRGNSTMEEVDQSEANSAATPDAEDVLSAAGVGLSGLSTKAAEGITIPSGSGADESVSESSDEEEDADEGRGADAAKAKEDVSSGMRFGCPIGRTKNTQQLAEEAAERLDKEQGAAVGAQKGSAAEQKPIVKEIKEDGQRSRLDAGEPAEDRSSSSESASSSTEEKKEKEGPQAEAMPAKPQTVDVSEAEEQRGCSGAKPPSSTAGARAPAADSGKPLAMSLLERAKNAVRIAGYVELEEEGGSPNGDPQEKRADREAVQPKLAQDAVGVASRSQVSSSLPPPPAAAAGGGMHSQGGGGETRRPARETDPAALLSEDAGADADAAIIADQDHAPVDDAAMATPAAAPDEARRASRGSKGKAVSRAAAVSQDKGSEHSKKASRPLTEKDPGSVKLQKKPSDPNKVVRFNSQPSNAGKEERKEKQGRSSGRSSGSSSGSKPRRRGASKQSEDPGSACPAEPLSDNDDSREAKQFTLDAQQPGQVNGIKWKFDCGGAMVKSVSPDLPGHHTLCPGDRLVSINETHVKRLSRQAIEEIWARAQQENRHLTLELLTAPQAEPQEDLLA